MEHSGDTDFGPALKYLDRVGRGKGRLKKCKKSYIKPKNRIAADVRTKPKIKKKNRYLIAKNKYDYNKKIKIIVTIV